jgi:hypothetical protein
MKTETTQGLPKWRLYANFLLRELARLWYGKKSIFDLKYGHNEDSPFWRDFVFIFWDMTVLFGRQCHLSKKLMDNRLKEAIARWEAWHGKGITFSRPCYEAKWRAFVMLGNKLSKKLFDDFDVGVILSFVCYIYAFASKGKLPPYGSFARLQPLEYYEALPVDLHLEDRYYNDEPLPF